MEHIRPPHTHASEVQKSLEKEKDWRSEEWETRSAREGEIYFTISRRKGFSAAEEVRKKNGAAVEVAGPTDRGFVFHEFDKGGGVRGIDLFKERPAFVSNLYTGRPEFHSVTGEIFRFDGVVDFVADARDLPIKDSAVELFYCSCLGAIAPDGGRRKSGAGRRRVSSEQNREEIADRIDRAMEITRKLREKTIDEAKRILKPGGLLIWTAAKPDDIAFALRQGFVVLQSEGKEAVLEEEGEQPMYNIIFMNPVTTDSRRDLRGNGMKDTKQEDDSHL